MPAALPTNRDLQRFLVAGGLFSNPLSDLERLLDLGGAIGDALEEWYDKTTFRPFLASGADVTRKFFPEGSDILPLDNGLVSFTSLYAGVTTTSTGSLLTRNDDFTLEPINAATRSEPYTYVQFLGRRAESRTSWIEITGKWGWWSTVPDKAFQSILKLAAKRLSPQIEHAISSGLVQWKAGDEERRWSDKGVFVAQREIWTEDALSAARDYRLKLVSF